MKRLERLLVYIDEPATLGEVLAEISEIVEGTECQVVFAGVVEPIPWRLKQTLALDTDELVGKQSKALSVQIENQVSALRQRGFDVAVKIYEGQPTRAIVNAVVDGKFDLLVKAAQERDGRFGASPDQRLLRHCPCPVAILRPRSEVRSQKIMAAVEMNSDDPENDTINDEIMDAASRIGIGYFKQLVVVHVWRLEGESMLSHGFTKLPLKKVTQLKKEEEQRHKVWLENYIGKYVARLGPEAQRYLQPELRLINGIPTNALIEQIEIEKPELLILGSVARTGLPGLLIGNTAESLAGKLQCSTLIVKPTDFRSPLMS